MSCFQETLKYYKQTYGNKNKNIDTNERMI